MGAPAAALRSTMRPLARLPSTRWNGPRHRLHPEWPHFGSQRQGARDAKAVFFSIKTQSGLMITHQYCSSPAFRASPQARSDSAFGRHTARHFLHSPYSPPDHGRLFCRLHPSRELPCLHSSAPRRMSDTLAERPVPGQGHPATTHRWWHERRQAHAPLPNRSGWRISTRQRVAARSTAAISGGIRASGGKVQNLRVAAHASMASSSLRERPSAFGRMCAPHTPRRIRRGPRIARGCVIPSIGGGLCSFPTRSMMRRCRRILKS